MKTIIAGSRKGAKLEDVVWAVENCGWQVTSVVSGTAQGVDQMGELVAEALGVPIHRFPADWEQFGKRAGFLRNVEMAENAEALIAVWNGESKGTIHMMNAAANSSLKIFVHQTGGFK